MDINYEKLFHINIKAMRASFCHPDIPRDKIWFLRFTIMHGILTLVFLTFMYSIIYHDWNTQNFTSLCKTGTYCVVYVTVTSQYLIMVFHRDTLKKVIEIMKIDFRKSKLLINDEQRIVLRYGIKGVGIVKQWFYLVLILNIVFTLKSILLTYKSTMTDEFRIVPFVTLVYPDVIESKRENLFVSLVVIYISQFYFSAYSSIIYVAFVPLGPMFMLHACGQLELVRNRVNRLYEGRSPEEVREELKSIAERLQFIYSFTDYINEAFRVLYEVFMKGSALIMPITFYEIVESIHRRDVSLELTTFFVGATIISSTPCFCSDLLMDKGEEVRLALYMCGWEREYDRSVRSTLVIMLVRALRPTAIRTIFRTVSLDALTDLCQQAYAIYNLLNAMWK